MYLQLNRVEDYYKATLSELNVGFCDLDTAREVLSIFEDVENYEACEGILKAIKEYEQKTTV